MKLKYVERINQHGYVHIPEDYQKDLGLCPGEEVELQRAGEQLVLKPLRGDKSKPARDVVDRLYGALEVAPQIAEEVSSDDYPYNPEDI